MRRFLQSLFPRWFQAPHTAKPKAAAQPKRPSAPSAASSAQPTASVGVSVGARRPLIAQDGKVMGFEFRMNRQLQERLTQKSMKPTQAAYATVLMTSALLVAKTHRVGVARLPADWLVLVRDAEVCNGMMVALEPPTEAIAPTDLHVLQHTILAMRAKGAKMGWGTAIDLGCNRDFVLIVQQSESIGTQLQSVQTWPANLRNLPLFATDLQNLQDIEQVLEFGVTYVCGALTRQSTSGDKKELNRLPPDAQRLSLLVSQLVGGSETPAIVESIKADVGLAYGLLRRINSASFARREPTTSIEHAVATLGRTELYRWLSILLLQYADSRRAASALQEITLWRARLMELLAAQRGETAPEQVFLLGLASMLGALLHISDEEVISTLKLGEPARQALLHHTGPWMGYLEAAKQVELGQQEAPAEVQELSTQAWAWAAAHMDTKAP
jgi:c-di-GMP phosphodiesterase